VEISCELVLIDQVLEFLETVLYVVDVRMRVFVILPEETSYLDDAYQSLHYHFLQILTVLPTIMTKRNELLIEARANSE